eukprot:5057794-Alexandrium_andersonii.AAC.1
MGSPTPLRSCLPGAFPELPGGLSREVFGPTGASGASSPSSGPARSLVSNESAFNRKSALVDAIQK